MTFISEQIAYFVINYLNMLLSEKKLSVFLFFCACSKRFKSRSLDVLCVHVVISPYVDCHVPMSSFAAWANEAGSRRLARSVHINFFGLTKWP